MIVQDQSNAVAFLMDPATHRIEGPVELIETHISRIFLAGRRAFKMKRAVRLPYADFSTPALRLATCENELALNSRTAPDLYLAVRRLTREPDGRIAFDGKGELVDAVVEMVRFDQDLLFDRMAAAGGLTRGLMSETARIIARFHQSASPSHTGGGAANMAGVLDINEAGFATSHIFTNDEIGRLTAAFRKALERHAALLDRRETAGKVRRCHGDLHLRNICLRDGEPRLFDCIEFSEKIPTIDILYDLAFLLMDLWHRDLPDLANLVANRYLDAADDEDGFVLLPFFMAVRAAVRAHVTASHAQEGMEDEDRLAAEARSYFDLAFALLRTVPPRLIAIGGLSGSGKSTVAEALAPRIGAPPGARIVESDLLRKAMHGVPPETRLPPAAYRPEVSERVYREMARRSGLILAQGGSVVADAVFDRGADRVLIESEASRRRTPFLGIWLDADPTLLRERVSARRGGPSDADVEVLARQLERKAGEMDWRRIDSGSSVDAIVEAILAAKEDKASDATGKSAP